MCVCVCVCVYVCVCECWILPGGVITATVHKFIVIQLLTFFVPFNLMEIHSCLGMSFLQLSLWFYENSHWLNVCLTPENITPGSLILKELALVIFKFAMDIVFLAGSVIAYLLL